MHNTTMGAYDDEDTVAYSPVDIVNNVVRMCLELHNEILSHSFVDLVCKLLVEEYVNLFVQLNIHVMVLGEDIFLQYRRSWVRVLCCKDKVRNNIMCKCVRCGAYGNNIKI